jgi:choline/glycine/proline betaine transport protein
MAKPATTISPPVFFTSGGLLIAFLLVGVFATDFASSTFPKILEAVSTYFGWLYVASVGLFIGLAVYLRFSRFAKIRLGHDTDRPDFSTPTWFAMLFSAGMGIGLLFYGVAEPMLHYGSPPTGDGASMEAARAALPLTFFHWGIHAWAIYVLMAMAIAYFAFRKDLPLSLRSCFFPLLGDRIYGPIGHLIDILAVFGTLFGLATSLGLGAMQVSAGLNHLFGVPHTIPTQLILIGLITLAATVSLVTGVENGIRRLSELNIITAGLLMLFVLAVGPTLFVVNSLFENLGSYLSVAFYRTFKIGNFQPDQQAWIQDWTLFYWGWWISWSPFVGMFVARISRGRTIGEFVTGVLLVPTAVTFVWLSVFGDTALYMEVFGQGGILAAVKADTSTAIYVMLEKLPLADITCLLAAAVVTIFFVTSSDSASFVVDMLTSGGHPNPPIWQRVFWAVAEGATAAVLLYAGGERALNALQAAVISIGLPFCVVLLFMCWSLLKALRQDPAARREPNPIRNPWPRPSPLAGGPSPAGLPAARIEAPGSALQDGTPSAPHVSAAEHRPTASP